MRYAFWIIGAGVVVLDQVTKYAVTASLPLNGSSVTIVPGFFWLTHVNNPGVAFGQLPNAGWLLILAAAVAAGAIIAYRAKLLREGPLPGPLLVGLALPLGGAIGNMIDRVRIGKVIDFLDFGWFSTSALERRWPVFNAADSAITIGALCLVYYFMFVSRPQPEAKTTVPEVATETE